MTLDEIRRYCNSMADKDRSGKTVTEQQFNDYIDVVNMEVFNIEYSKILQTSNEQGIPMHQLLSSETSLKEFKVYDESKTVSSGEADLPALYKHYLSIRALLDDKHRPVEVVSDYEFNQVKSNILSKNPAQNPVAVIFGSKLKIIPSSTLAGPGLIGPYNVVFNYLKSPAQPIYDYCMVIASREIVYMPVGSYLASDNVLYTSYLVGATVIKSGVTHLTESIPHTSTSVEFEWRDDVHPKLAKRILIKMGISLKDGEVFQMTKAEDK